jgi:hypothetical protein
VELILVILDLQMRAKLHNPMALPQERMALVFSGKEAEWVPEAV